MAETSWSEPPARVPQRESGPLHFARFAYRPNDLGYCGGNDAASLFQHVIEGVTDPGLRQLCGEFEGAYPYLEDLAVSAGIVDPLDPRVVEAYWVGSPLLEAIQPAQLSDDLERRFRGRTARGEWSWLAGKPAAGAVPHHSFHVLEVFPRVGLLRGAAPTDIVPVMERCLVRPARVRSVEDGELLVEVRPLAFDAGKLVFGEPRVERVVHRIGGAGFVAGVAPGDDIAIHWGWACDRLDGARRDELVRAIERSLYLANQTL